MKSYEQTSVEHVENVSEPVADEAEIVVDPPIPNRNIVDAVHFAEIPNHRIGGVEQFS